MKPLATLNRPVLKTVDTETKEASVTLNGADRRHRGARRRCRGRDDGRAGARHRRRSAKFGGDSMDELVRNHDALPRASPLRA